MKKYNNYYFTFGSSPSFPYQNGWVMIQAPNKQAAIQIFNAYYPPKSECVNCAFIYTEEEFKQTIMYKQNENLGAGCHYIIAPVALTWEVEEEE